MPVLLTDNPGFDKAPKPPTDMNAVAALTISLALLVPGPGSQPQPSIPETLPPSSTRALATQELTYKQARHLLMRAGFGGSPEQIKKLQQMGLQAAVAYLVDYERLPQDVPGHGVIPPEPIARGTFRRLSQDERRSLQRMRRRTDGRKLQRLRGWWLRRMVASERQLEEKMTLFWHGHFTSGYRDVRNAFHMAIQNDLLREHATGNFGDLVRAISRDPAMLEYLDNRVNGRRKPNENYARELMELFTLGEGNYTEKDVKEAARAFTGWTFRRGTSTFTFQERNHDYGKKTFLGQQGYFDGDHIIDIILAQEAACRHLARKLLGFFAVDATDEEIAPYARLLRRTNFELKPFFRTLFSSEWFHSDRVMGKIIKSPVVLVVSTIRMMGVTIGPGNTAATLARYCDQIGQSLLQPPNVKGWDGGAAWVTSSNLLTRYNITRSLITGVGRGGDNRNRRNQRNRRPIRSARQEMDEMDMRGQARNARNDRAQGPAGFDILALVKKAGVSRPAEIVSLLEERFLVTPISKQRRQALFDFLEGADGSPALNLDSTRRATNKLNELLHLITTTPEFQIC
ncbi:MAG: DUF1800 domain-containing protein [Planctomycetota bacterium]